MFMLDLEVPGVARSTTRLQGVLHMLNMHTGPLSCFLAPADWLITNSGTVVFLFACSFGFEVHNGCGRVLFLTLLRDTPDSAGEVQRSGETRVIACKASAITPALSLWALSYFIQKNNLRLRYSFFVVFCGHAQHCSRTTPSSALGFWFHSQQCSEGVGWAGTDPSPPACAPVR